MIKKYKIFFLSFFLSFILISFSFLNVHNTL